MIEMADRAAQSSALLAIEAKGDEVRRASVWLEQTGRQQGVPAEQIGRLELCLNEAVANVIAHGGSGAAFAPVWLRLEVKRKSDCSEASVTVSDAGPAFDSTSGPLKPRPATLSDAEPGGLGLAMIRSFCDALAYRRVDGRNELTFSVRWGEA
jgi:anti-sigma regulatory factor (Ser/Thr protein kinase)